MRARALHGVDDADDADDDNDGVVVVGLLQAVRNLNTTALHR